MTPTIAPRPSDRRHRRRRALALALSATASLATAAAVAAPVQADSLVFVKDANVWLANPDGSGLYQVTTDGTADNPYASPSQADDGTIVTVRAKPNLGPLILLKQNGELIRQVPVAPMQAGPFQPAISPDGRLIAYEHAFTNTFETSNDTRMTSADGLTAPTVYGHPGSGAGSPSWIDSGRILVGDYTSAITMVPGQAASEWWSDWDHEPLLGSSEDLDDGEAASNGAVAFVRGDRDGNTIQLYRSSGLTAAPTPTCTLSNPSPGPLGARFADPTFAPGGGAIAWQEGDGIWTAALPAGDCASATPRLTIPGASQPDWGPAPVAPGPRPQRPAEAAPSTIPPAATLKAALARCAAGPKRRRGSCAVQARRAAAVKACARKPRQERRQCVAKARRVRR